jgi:hypothetical protein
MAKELKRFPVDNQEQALELINKLSKEFNLAPKSPSRSFEVSNEHYAAYYDAKEKMVKMEAIHPNVTEEQIKEFLINFPPFF